MSLWFQQSCIEEINEHWLCAKRSNLSMTIASIQHNSELGITMIKRPSVYSLLNSMSQQDIFAIIPSTHHCLCHSQMCRLQSQPSSQEYALKRLVRSITRVIPGYHLRVIVICLSQMKLNGQMQLVAVWDMVRDTLFKDYWSPSNMFRNFIKTTRPIFVVKVECWPALKILKSKPS